MQLAPQESSLVVATYGRRFEIRLDSGERVPARIKGRRLRPVCGDRVEAAPLEGEKEWLIGKILRRENVLQRPDSRGRSEALAANLDLVVVVAAEVPPPDRFLIDRYLAAAELMGVDAMLVVNKADLRQAGNESELGAEFEALGYPVAVASAATGSGLERIEALIGARLAILVGQSGVGKSSLVNRLLRTAGRETGALSEKSGSGRHTTVNSVLLELPGGGGVIDSPGVRDYAPVIDEVDRVAHGFREIAALAPDCRYANCRHLREPECAVKKAVAAGAVSERRYDSYRRLLQQCRRFADRY